MDGLNLADVVEENEDDFDHEEHFTDEDDDDDNEHNDPFERDWAEKWLSGVVRRAQTWLESEAEPAEQVAAYEAVLREATAVLALMAGTSAAGSLTRHLLFPLAAELVPALRALRPFTAPNPQLSPQTSSFLSQLATSPVSPLIPMRRLSRNRSDSISSTTSTGKKRRLAALPVLLHDAPISDHLSVGVQTWGSAILLGREMALRPADFGLFQDNLPHGGGTRVLELGAGTGLLSILCRKLLDLQSATAVITAPDQEPKQGIVVATDFHPDVIANLRVCVDLNAPPRLPGQPAGPGIEIAKLDWTTFPAFMERRAGWITEAVGDEELAPWVDTPFDLVLASDCVYDPTHAALLRKVAGWVLRPPSPSDAGGTMVCRQTNVVSDQPSISCPRSDRRLPRSWSQSTWPSPLWRPTRPWLIGKQLQRARDGTILLSRRNCAARASAPLRDTRLAYAVLASSPSSIAVVKDGVTSMRDTGGGRLDGDSY